MDDATVRRNKLGDKYNHTPNQDTVLEQSKL
jgi:hypothetical protein